ncbi:substrate-binding periplasmic protein [Alteromonas sp. H39]|uniref:substrate-binding periplasmic protein n=1 Tax=Alteromonas sp. H39 TaxID=3389876 RepID=UPI0039E1AF82
MMRSYWHLVCLMLTTLLISLAGRASENVTVAVSPLPVFSENLEHDADGFNVRVVKGITQEAGLTAEFITMPFSRVMTSIQKDHAMLATSVARTPAREDDFYWITPMTASHVAMFVKRSHPLAGRSVAQLKDIGTVSAMHGDYRETILQENGVTSIMSLNSWEQAIGAVVKDRADGIFFSYIGLQLICKRNRLDCGDLVPVIDWNTSYNYLVLSKHPDNAELAARLTVAASRYKSSSAFDALLDAVLPELSSMGVAVEVKEGVLSFQEPFSLEADDLWVIADYVPHFSEPDAKGEVTGYAANLVRAILAEAELERPILSAPWERIMREAARKPNVLAFSVARTPDREPLFHWITPITRNMHGLYKTDAPAVTRLEDVSGDATIAVIRKDYRGKVARDAGLKTLSFDSWETAMAALLSRDADYLFGSAGAVSVACQNLDRACDEVSLALNYQATETYLALSKSGTNPILAERLRSAAEKVKQSEAYYDWSQAWSQEMLQRHNVIQHVDNGIVNLWKKEK